MSAMTSSTAPRSILPILRPVIGLAPRPRRFLALRAAWAWVMAPMVHEAGALRRIERARTPGS